MFKKSIKTSFNSNTLKPWLGLISLCTLGLFSMSSTAIEPKDGSGESVESSFVVPLATPKPVSTAAADQFPQAPLLRELEMHQGEAFQIDNEKITVVELWATWCGPCIQAMPKMSDFYNRKKDQINVIALSSEKKQVVSRFMKRNPNLMSYPVATSSSTVNDYHYATASRSIPHSIVVQNKQILWHGHPADVEGVVKELIENGWSAEKSQILQDIGPLTQKIFEHIGQDESDKAKPLVKKLLKVGYASPNFFNTLSWKIMTELPEELIDIDLAFQLADIAVKGSEHRNDSILDTLALAYFKLGDTAAAIETQKKAIEICKKKNSKCQSLEGTLKIYLQHTNQ